MRFRAVAILVALSVAGTLLWANGPHEAFSGRILFSAQRFPVSAKSPASSTAALRKQAATSFQENKASKNWKIYFAAFLKSKLAGTEYTLKIYAIDRGKNTLLATLPQFTDSRGQDAILSALTLERKEFGVNRELLIDIEAQGKVLAAGRLKILGEGEKYSGKVNFNEN